MLSIDTTDMKKYQDELKKIHRSRYPLSVRQTLNDLAFDVYKQTLPAQYKKEFTVRNKTFLRSHSGVEKAQGFDLNKMAAHVGITPKGSKAAQELSKQEYGGSNKKPFIYLDTARSGKNRSRLVRQPFYVNKRKIIHGPPNKTRSLKSQFVADAFMALKENLPFLVLTKKGLKLADVKYIHKIKNKVGVALNMIASYKKGRTFSLTPRHFLQKASINSYKKISELFIANAKKNIERAMKK